MIGIFAEDGVTRLLQTYNGLQINDPSAAVDNLYEVNAVTPHIQFDAISDPNPSDDGTEIYGSRKVLSVISIAGTIRAQSNAALYDKIKAMVAAFDPAKASHENSTVQGFLAYDFSTPTADVTTYPTGLVACRYYARARTLYIPAISEYTGLSSFFTLELEMADPRRYEQTQATLAGTGTATNRGDYRTWPTLTISCTGAGNAAWTLTRTGTGIAATTKALVLDLTTCLNNDTVTVDMQAKRITRTRSGVTTDHPELATAAAVFFELEPTSQTLTLTNGTNTTVSTAWRHAYCI